MRLASSLTLAAFIAIGSTAALAEGQEAGKDCHVIRTCNFSTSASVRGCLSSYSCRQCQLVKRGTVTVNGVKRTIWGSTCTWGGAGS